VNAKKGGEWMPGKFIRKDEYNPRRVVADDEFERVLSYTNNAFKVV
jgi:hypothetical protein